MLYSLFLPVVPEVVVDPLFDELQWRLRAECVFGRHVEVVHERQELLASNWNINTWIHPDISHTYVATILHKETNILPQLLNRKRLVLNVRCIIIKEVCHATIIRVSY